MIETLSKSKVTSNQIMEQVKVAEKTQLKISDTRAGYQVRPVLDVSQLSLWAPLAVCVCDLRILLSLCLRVFVCAACRSPRVPALLLHHRPWLSGPDVPVLARVVHQPLPARHREGAQGARLLRYSPLFCHCPSRPHPPQSRDLAERLQALNDTFTFVLYQNVCRSLFAKDKLLFSFLLCMQISVDSGSINPAELRFFLQGSISLVRSTPVAGGIKSYAQCCIQCR